MEGETGKKDIGMGRKRILKLVPFESEFLMEDASPALAWKWPPLSELGGKA